MGTEIVVAIVAVIVLSAVAAAWSLRSRSTSTPSGTPSALDAPDRLPVTVADFRVAGNDAQVYFAVPIPDEGPNHVLGELLTREAVEVVREKRHALPIDEVERVVAFGKDATGWVEVGVESLEAPGQLPPPLSIPLLPIAGDDGFDAWDRLVMMEAKAPGLAERRPGDDLPPIGLELTLTSQVDAGLRSLGVDPAEAGAGDLVLSIMRLVGYTVHPGGEQGVAEARKGGQRVLVQTVDHGPGEYPELDEATIRSFVVRFVQSGCDRGLLVTDKYAPFAIHDRERREPRVRFIARERMQEFVDALSVG